MVPLVHIHFFMDNLAAIFFFYGLAFYSLGLAILLEVRKASKLRIAAVLPYLALFGILDGVHEWLEMLVAIGGISIALEIFIIASQAIAAIFLDFFGSETIGRLSKYKWARIVPFILILLTIVAISFILSEAPVSFVNLEVIVLYFLFFPGCILAGIGLIIKYKELLDEQMDGVANNFFIAAILFFVLGIFEGIVTVPKSTFFPANILNDQLFISFIHVPSQFFRSILGVLIAVFIIRGLRVFEEEKQRRFIFLEEKRRILDILQTNLLKSKKPVINGLDISTHYESATLEAAIGGDFYDFIELDDQKWAIAVGDVSGKGIEAASDAFLTSQALRSLVYECEQPEEMMKKINNVVWRQTPSGFFVTMVLFIYDKKQNNLVYSVAGHPFPIIFNSKGGRFLTESGTALGINQDEIYGQEEVPFHKGDMLVLYTDGLVEAKSNGELFGDERLKNLVEHNRNLSPQSLNNHTMAKVTSFSKGVLRDDIVLAVIKKK